MCATVHHVFAEEANRESPGTFLTHVELTHRARPILTAIRRHLGDSPRSWRMGYSPSIPHPETKRGVIRRLSLFGNALRAFERRASEGVSR